jgi:ADP-heptose:LPS heptosyltransferase
VLVINTFGIGDMVMTTPLLRCLRKAWPSAHICLLVKAFGAERVVRGTSLVDTVIVHGEKDRRSVHQGIRLLRSLLSRPPVDICVVTTGKNPVLAGMASLAARARWRVGEDIGGRGVMYTHRLPFRPRLHTVLANLRLATALGLETDDSRLLFALTKCEREFAERFLRDHGVVEPDRPVAVQVGCNPAFSHKRWPVAHVALLCDMLESRGIGTPILVGSPGESDLANEIASRVRSPVVTAVGKTTLGEAAALLERSAVAVGGDGGLLHVAAAVQTPTVAVFGPSDPARNRPWGGRHKVISAGLPCSPCYPRLRHGCGDPRCMGDVSPELVARAVEDVAS